MNTNTITTIPGNNKKLSIEAKQPKFNITTYNYGLESVAAPAIVGVDKTSNPYNFKIEVVKWEWPAPVKNKEVYRDDEFVRTKTKEEALGAIKWLMGQPKGLTYTITVYRENEDENKGKYFTFHRHSMPCLGGICKYLDSHGEKFYMNAHFPRDIRVMFPEGDIIYIACHRPNVKDIFKSFAYWEFIFSEESPWRTAFDTKETIIWEDNHFVLTAMESTDATVFYSLMRLAGLAHFGIYGSIGAPQNNTKINPRAELLLTKSTMYADPRRLAGAKPIKISGGTWSQGFPYTRPFNESIFKTSIPCKFADFRSLKSYPQAPYVNTYFIETMKKNYGVDISGAQLTNPKTHDALVSAWDYFREESKKLSDIPGVEEGLLKNE